MTHTHTDLTRDVRRSWTGLGGCFAVLACLIAATMAAGAQEMPTGPAAREVRELACAPVALRSAPSPLGRVTGSTELKRGIFSEGDTIVINQSTGESLEPGQTYYVRRELQPHDRSMKEAQSWTGLTTVGWVKVTESQGGTAMATVVYSCDALEVDDELFPFSVPAVPEPVADRGTPDFESPGQVLFGPERHSIAGGADMVVIDRGTSDGLRLGQLVTFFRRTEGDKGPRLDLGEGMIVIALPDSSTVRVTKAAQPIYQGDLVALHR
jgi:hypothetical protein